MLRLLIRGTALAFAVFHAWSAFFGSPPLFIFRGTHLLLALIMVFLLTISTQSDGKRLSLTPTTLIAMAGAAASIVSLGYILLSQDYILYRIPYIDPLSGIDIFMGSALILALLEATRRTTGIALPITALAFILYALFIANIPFLELLDHLYMTSEGIFGIPLSVSATYMALFIMFGAMVEYSGTGILFRDLALALAGRSSGGPAKVAVIASGMFGSVSGSSTANVMTTGSFTIKMMQQIGYRPAFAGAVEAVASTGGQILPPIMGAAAFVMAEFMGRSYLEVIVFATIPALLYFLSVFMAVHFEAKRNGLTGVPKADLPEIRAVLKARGHQILPLIIMVGMLFWGYSAPLAGLLGCLLVFPVAALRKTTRSVCRLDNILDAITQGAKNAAPVACVTAIAGIVIGSVTMTGIGVEFTQFILRIAQGSLLPALILTALAGMVLGMGLPTTPAYIIQVSLLVPALINMGIVEPAAHLFALYFAIMSSITPPVAITLFAAMSLSGAKLGETSLAALKLSIAGYLVPFLFVFGPELLMIGSPPEVIISIMTACLGVTLIAAGLHGYLFTKLNPAMSFFLVIASLLLAYSGAATDIIGLAIATGVIIKQLLKRRNESKDLFNEVTHEER